MCLIENETRLVSCSDDRTIKVWLTSYQWSCLYTICDAHADWIVTLCYLGLNRKSFVSGSCDHKIRIWNLETGECENVIEGHSDWVRTLAFIATVDIKDKMNGEQVKKDEKVEEIKVNKGEKFEQGCFNISKCCIIC